MSKILKYKKIIMLALVLVSIITCVCAAYITEYKKTKVTPEILFTEIEETRTYKDSEEFLKNYEYFYIYTERYVEATEDDKGNLINGTHKFKVASKDAQTKNAKLVTIEIKLAANWINFQSNSATTSNYTSKKGATLTISNIAQIFPAKGKLLFTKVEEPTLYVLIKWTENDGSRYYTFMELDCEQYSEVPYIPAEPTVTPEHDHNH
jgi:hypothetical protein